MKSLFLFLISSVAFGVCNEQSPVVRLDQPGGSLEKFKTIDQDGMGICYASVASVMLKSAYPNEETPSQLDLAMKYTRDNPDDEASLKKQIDAGKSHTAFNLATKDSVCKAKDINFEVASNDFGSSSMRTYFDKIEAFKSRFDELNPNKDIYFDKLSSLSSQVEKQCDKPHDKLVRISIKNAFISLRSFYLQTRDEVQSMEKIVDDLNRSLPLVKEIEEDAKKLNDKRDDLLNQIAQMSNEESSGVLERKKSQLDKVDEKLKPFNDKLLDIKRNLGEDLFKPSDEKMSQQILEIIEDNKSLIDGLKPEIASAKKDLDEIGTVEGSSVVLSSKVDSYLKGEFRDSLKEFASDFNKVKSINDEQAGEFYNKTVRLKFNGLDDFYHSPKGTLLDFKMNNPFLCAQNYFKENLKRLEGEQKPYYNMCTLLEKDDIDETSFDALSSILESGSNMIDLFPNIENLIDHLSDVSQEDDLFKSASDYLKKQCVDLIDYKSAPKKKAKPVYLGVSGSYESFKTKTSQKKKVLDRHIDKSLDKGHAIGLSIAGKMLKGNYNAFEQESNGTLETEDFEHGLHAVTLIGVDCSSAKKKYLIQNSWGTSCHGVKDIASIKCEEGTGRLWIEEDYLLNNTRYITVVD